MATHHMLSLPQARVAHIERDDESLVLVLSEYFIFTTLTGSDEETKWRQAGRLRFRTPKIEGELPECPCVIRTGDMLDNGFVFRDRVELPLDSSGQVGCVLKFHGQTDTLRVDAEHVVLEPTDERRYVEHVRPE